MDLNPAQVKQLERSLVLFDTGQTRRSSTLHEHVWGNYRMGRNQGARVRLREIASEMVEALTAGDGPTLGALLSENWVCQKALHPSITNEAIEDLFELLPRVGIQGGKACGAGGRGGLLFLVEPERRGQIEGVLQNFPGEIIPFPFDFEGLMVERRR